MQGSAPPRHLPALTGIRFLAAMHVVIFHSADWASWTVPALREVASSGYVAVSMFFVLSGLILAYTYSAPSRAAVPRRPFYVARFARIYPMYALGLLLCAPFVVVAHLRKGGGNIFVEGLAVVTLV